MGRAGVSGAGEERSKGVVEGEDVDIEEIVSDGGADSAAPWGWKRGG